MCEVLQHHIAVQESLSFLQQLPLLPGEVHAKCLFDWDYMEYRSRLLPLWKHIPFGDDETMPLMSQVLVQEKLARVGNLNTALRFCGLPEYETAQSRWFAQRCSAYSARLFYGTYGSLYVTNVTYSFRCQAVTLWNPK